MSFSEPLDQLHDALEVPMSYRLDSFAAKNVDCVALVGA